MSDDITDIEGNEYLDPKCGERFHVKRVENWGGMIVAIMEYEDGVKYDQPADWVKQKCELLAEDVTPVDLNFYNDEGILDKAIRSGGDFAEKNQDMLPNKEIKLAEFFKNKVRGNQVKNTRGRRFDEEIERFRNAGVGKGEVVEKMWRGFAESCEIYTDLEIPSEEEVERAREIATS